MTASAARAWDVAMETDPAPLDALLALLANPARRELLQKLQERPRRVRELARGMAVERPAVSRHLLRLVEAGVARRRQLGGHHVYELTPGRLHLVAEFVRGLTSAGVEERERPCPRPDLVVERDVMRRRGA